MEDLEAYLQQISDLLAEHDMTEDDIDLNRVSELRLTGMAAWEAFAILA